MTVLVTGWFSFESMGASAGDLLARDVVCGWLADAGHRFDIAVAPPFQGGIDWRTADPTAYHAVIFVCGPLGPARVLKELLARFAHCRLVAVDVSLLQTREQWNPFHAIFERDSDVTSRPDISLLAPSGRVPLVGLLLIDVQTEYAERDRHTEANAAVHRLLESRSAAVIRVDTRLDTNTTGLRTPAEIESVIARMDLVLTTRLHGLVLAIKNAVPVIAIDPVAGGAKVTRQAAALAWPLIFDVDRVTPAELDDAFASCLTPAARAEAEACRQRALRTLDGLDADVIAALSTTADHTLS